MNGSPSIKQLLLGRQQSQTRRALLLAAGLFLATAGVGLLLGVLSWDHKVLYGVHQAFYIEIGFDQLIETTFSRGLIVIIGLSAIHAYFNDGYLPSLLLATAPIYGRYVFTVPGPVLGVVVPITEEVVFAPYWAALHVFPNTIAFGTVGFLIGPALRHLYRETAITSTPT